MFKFLIILLFCSAIGCEQESTVGLDTIKTMYATIYGNNLPVDGCAEHIVVEKENGNSENFLSTEATKPVFVSFLNNQYAELPKDYYTGHLRIPVVIKYKETQEKGELLCGWGHKSTVPLIQIISITKL